MGNQYDEISLVFWKQRRENAGSSKSYTCIHNGLVYGIKTPNVRFAFVYIENGSPQIYNGTSKSLKSAYYELVKKACSISNKTTDNFLYKGAKKFRIYTKQQVEAFSQKERTSTRITDDSSRILVNGIEYYVANNLKLCEYFNNAANKIDPEELDKWFIRMYFEVEDDKTMEDSDETEYLSQSAKPEEYNLTVNINPVSTSLKAKKTRTTTKEAIKVDYEKLNKTKKRIGDLGEAIVLEYEKKRLIGDGRKDLADRIEHSSVKKGDGLGYDIQSFNSDGSHLFIEVKTTKQNRAADFYLSNKEKTVAEEMYKKQINYRVYRVYKLNEEKGIGELTFFDPPFNSTNYEMLPKIWHVSLKDHEDE